ncbi:MAG TPA: B12-binding domain-containing radical SAM protein [Gemmatimonadota bacterium]|nr:B12-binding domain-containing radical SAM protein [Gemmatimonadota bacterium]
MPPLLEIEGVRPVASGRAMKGLLLAPEFPPNSFWSYRHIMPMIGKKAAFPPLGLLTFAAFMPDNWEFELIDLNVERPSDEELRERMAAADAVFTGAMSVQKRSLVRLLEGPARGLDTPWVLGGPYPSSYRDQILDPKTHSDAVLHEGLDVLVWGEGGQWIDAICRILDDPQLGRHRSGQPLLLIPDAIAGQAPGSRKALNDRSIFRELEYTPPPRWDLVDIHDYRALMKQTTVGCRFRCDFCDIIQFNGGFTRPKTLESIREELAIMYDLGHRGGIFTVDDNFVGNPQAIEVILEEIISFQREHDYPFSFYTQASLDLGSPKLQHLLPLMKQAGFNEVFLGIENPDPTALKNMNKKQNLMVDIAGTVGLIQDAGIEVMAGFIFGGDEDTPQTADAIANFAKKVAIPTAMTGMLTPIPHTPLAERLREEGRLLESEFSGNNSDDDVQLIPRNMTPEAMKTNYHRILQSLFGPGEIYQRASDLIDRLNPHIFRSAHVSRSDIHAALQSLWKQGILSEERRAYRRLLWKAARCDFARYRSAGRAAADLGRKLAALASESKVLSLTEERAGELSAMIERARDALVRARPDRTLDEVRRMVERVREGLEARRVAREDAELLYGLNREFFRYARRAHRFPGVYLVKAFELSIKGMHYETVMMGIVRGD